MEKRINFLISIGHKEGYFCAFDYAIDSDRIDYIMESISSMASSAKRWNCGHAIKNLLGKRLETGCVNSSPNTKYSLESRDRFAIGDSSNTKYSLESLIGYGCFSIDGAIASRSIVDKFIDMHFYEERLAMILHFMEFCEMEIITKIITEKTKDIVDFLANATPSVLKPELYIIHEATGITKRTSKFYKCPNCGEKNCYTQEKQTRASDEAASLFCECVSCGKFWKEY